MDQEIKLHHANLVIGGDNRDFVYKILKEKLDFNIHANPDFLLIENKSFGIGDVRDFENWIIGKPLVGEVKASFVCVESITHEAQNALLKVLEEPPFGTYIFINLASLGGLLPTFLSRVRIIENIFEQENNSTISLAQKRALKFLDSDINGKFTMIRTLAKSADKTDAREVLKNLEEVYRQNLTENSQSDKTNAKNLEHLLTAKILASSKGSSPKMLLEWLACVLQ